MAEPVSGRELDALKKAWISLRYLICSDAWAAGFKSPAEWRKARNQRVRAFDALVMKLRAGAALRAVGGKGVERP